METKTDLFLNDTRVAESATVVHDGREFTSGGFAIDVEAGKMIAYVAKTSAPGPTHYTLTTWDGKLLARLERTDNHTRGGLRAFCPATCGPVGFGGVRLEAFRTLDPIAGFHWYGRGLGAGMMIRMKRGRKA